MRLKDLHLKIQTLWLRRFLFGSGTSKKRKHELAKKHQWMMPISHGYHVVEDQSFRSGSDESDCDSVVVQREQVDEIELWFFGVFDAQIGNSVTKFMQSHFFNRKLKPSQIRRKSEETMRKAYLGARAKAREADKADKTWSVGSASVMVINGEKLVIANMGGYRTVVSRDGVAHQISAKRHWSKRCFSAGTKQSKGSELAVGAGKIDSETEFVLIASNAMWEVMKNQEAVSLIRYIEDAQEAADYLANEALTRMSISSVSCLVIRLN